MIPHTFFLMRQRVNAGMYMFGSFKIKFKHGTDRDVIWRVKRDIDRVAAAVENRVPPPPGTTIQPPQVLAAGVSQKFEPTLIRVTLECPSWKRDHVKAVSRFCGTIRSICIDLRMPMLAIKGEMGPP
eukprot:3825854-Pyramimonas_sp.AAC.1